MKNLRLGLMLVAAAAALAAPAAANAEYLVPPGNSAATQYTEAIPSAGGPKDSNRTGRQKARSAATVLGTQNARRLHSEGRAGREIAAVAAETAPESIVPAQSRRTRSLNPPGHRTKHKPRRRPPGHEPPLRAAPGSSGFGEVLGQATGYSSTGSGGLVLPLAIVAGLAWAVAYWARQRNRSV
jgi:hypothetical protein